MKNYRFTQFFTAHLTTSSRQTPRLRFPAKGGKALMRRCPSSSAQRHGGTNCKKRSLCSVFCKTFAYHLCAVKRSSLRSERCRSELLFVKKEKLRTSLLCFTFHMRLTALFYLQMTFFRTFAESGSAIICHCPGSIPKRHNVGASPFNPPQFSKRKITAWFYGLPLHVAISHFVAPNAASSA